MINYKIIHSSINYYQKEGFERIEVPWVVPNYYEKLTKPEGKNSFQINNKDEYLIASGEQSFLYLYSLNQLPKGRFQTVTPCFRDDYEDLLHNKVFIKNELISTSFKSPDDELYFMIDKALVFFENWLGTTLSTQKTKEGFDISFGKLELGSYGVRENQFLKYVYGTGVAEPRLTKIYNIINGIP